MEVAPEDFKKKSVVAIEDNINAKYANKVIQKIGLCVCLYDLLWASEGLIGHGTGLVNVNGMSSFLGCWKPLLTYSRVVVEFRLVVFRPFKGEVMLGRIRNSTPIGINGKERFCGFAQTQN